MTAWHFRWIAAIAEILFYDVMYRAFAPIRAIRRKVNR